MTEKLKPCPFCGTYISLQVVDRTLGRLRERWHVRCPTCDLLGKEAESPENAITYWNTRTPDPLVQAVVDAAGEWHTRTIPSTEMALNRAVRKLREAQG